MVHLDCSGIWFGSQLDEKHLFQWAAEIPGFLRWEQDTLVIRSRLSEASLRDLLSLFSRYEISMGQLAQFQTSKNEHWFAAPHTYWHKRVFGSQKPNRALQRTAPSVR
ncbi:hypothetical protein [Acidovorax sp. Leaf78]|uniref:hypothetical protein n=1 Tax=Acidovorax sp. Leaf78 TaxID=1736237 RepID=UPI0006FBD79D|nr:hypothetical protein [Acidovorax sp. Leaf78]KQO19038.1 hypothetical protein ASF16_10470 [Acidovorax sp. Leaf78]